MLVDRETDAVEPSGVAGIDGPKIERWMATLAIDAPPPLTLALAGQGKSNITAIVTADDGQRWVLRRPPLGNLLPTAHDVTREYRILSALRDTAVPVPTPIALTDDPAITDAPLMLMEHVDGLVIDDGPQAEALPREFLGAAGRALLEAIAAVHAVDLAETGLTDLASHRPFAARQLKRWRAQWEESRTHGSARVDKLAERLATAMPEHEDLVLVHGDCHIRNAILDRTSGNVRALLDWEMSTLGDPLSDLGLLLAYWAAPDDPPGQPLAWLALPGLPNRSELVELYEEIAGRDTTAVGFWEVLALWKIVIILEGIRRRALNDRRNAERGATVDQETIDAVVERAWETANTIGI